MARRKVLGLVGLASVLAISGQAAASCHGACDWVPDPWLREVLHAAAHAVYAMLQRLM